MFFKDLLGCPFVWGWWGLGLSWLRWGEVGGVLGLDLVF